MNIHIFYSHYNVTGTDNKSRPQWFDYEKCFVNLLNTIKDKSNIKLNIVMDGKIEDNWIKKYKEFYNATSRNVLLSVESSARKDEVIIASEDDTSSSVASE